MEPDGLLRDVNVHNANNYSPRQPRGPAVAATIPMQQQHHKQTRAISFQRVASWVTTGKPQQLQKNRNGADFAVGAQGLAATAANAGDAEDGDDSVRDFDASEWTPPDSSYGAAIPVAGWIPKGIRRSIEWTVLGCVAALIVFLIVRTSLRADSNNHSSSGSRYHHNNRNNSNNSTNNADNTTSSSTTATDDYYRSYHRNDDYYISYYKDGTDDAYVQQQADDATSANDDGGR